MAYGGSRLERLVALEDRVSQPAATTHRYVACICNGGGTNAQAESAPVVVSWR